MSEHTQLAAPVPRSCPPSRPIQHSVPRLNGSPLATARTSLVLGSLHTMTIIIRDITLCAMHYNSLLSAVYDRIGRSTAFTCNSPRSPHSVRPGGAAVTAPSGTTCGWLWGSTIGEHRGKGAASRNLYGLMSSSRTGYRMRCITSTTLSCATSITWQGLPASIVGESLETTPAATQCRGSACAALACSRRVVRWLGRWNDEHCFLR